MSPRGAEQDPASPAVAPSETPAEHEHELARTREEAKNLRAERTALAATNAELERRLAVRGEELDSLVVQLSAIERIVVSLERTIEELREQRAESGNQPAEPAAPAAAQEQPAESELRAMLERERAQTIEEVRRAASSRAWRWGHGVTRLLRTLTFRRSARSAGALEALLARLESEQLPAPDETSSASPPDPSA
jgi:chromosome segregation ATPase